MNKTAAYVDNAIAEMKAQGMTLEKIAWETALLCVGWAYVFGARGEYCTPSHRRTRYNATAAGQNKDNIKNRCKNFDGTGTCSGCQWFPENQRTRDFDCRGFTYWVLKAVYGWELKGAGCTSQWNEPKNWKRQGNVSDGIPQDVPVCVFYYKRDENGNKTKTVEHTGLYYNGQTVEASKNVQHSTTLNKKWEIWGVPACVNGEVPPVPVTKPTLKKGDRGAYVTLAQTELSQKGYSCGAKGADGIFGNATLEAVKALQKDYGLTVDGIIGQDTWDVLDSAEPPKKFTVTIPHLTESLADTLISEYPGSTKTEERG